MRRVFMGPYELGACPLNYYLIMKKYNIEGKAVFTMISAGGEDLPFVHGFYLGKNDADRAIKADTKLGIHRPHTKEKDGYETRGPFIVDATISFEVDAFAE